MQSKYFFVGLILLCGSWFYARGMEAFSPVPALPAEEQAAIKQLEGILVGENIVLDLHGRPLTTTVVNMMFGAVEPENATLKLLWETRQKIEYLDLADCGLTDKLILSECTALEKLYLSGNKGLKSVNLGKMPNLKTLTFTNCALAGELDLSGCTALENLYLFGNGSLTLVKGLENMHSLNELHLGHCYLLTGTLDLSGCTALRTVDLAGSSGVTKIILDPAVKDSADIKCDHEVARVVASAGGLAAAAPATPSSTMADCFMDLFWIPVTIKITGVGEMGEKAVLDAVLACPQVLRYPAPVVLPGKAAGVWTVTAQTTVRNYGKRRAWDLAVCEKLSKGATVKVN